MTDYEQIFDKEEINEVIDLLNRLKNVLSKKEKTNYCNALEKAIELCKLRISENATNKNSINKFVYRCPNCGTIIAVKNEEVLLLVDMGL